MQDTWHVTSMPLRSARWRRPSIPSKISRRKTNAGNMVGVAISEATALCLQRFTECLAAEALMKDEWAENRLADFNLWVSGVGASARERASLDARLTGRPEAREVIANLLCLLANVVDECKQLALSGNSDSIPASENEAGADDYLAPDEPPARPFSPWSDDSYSDSESESEETGPISTRNPLQDSMHNIEMMLDQLARIAVAVRRSGRRSRLQKADQRFNPQDHRALEEHLTTILLARPEFVEEQVDPSKLTEVQRRLIRCNLKRRNRFLYAQHHSKGLDPVSMQNQYRMPDPETRNIRPGDDGNQKSRPIISKLWNGTMDTRTGTSASAMSNSFALKEALVPAAAASTVMSSTVIDLEYPRPPKINKDAQIFRCPCCCATYPVSQAERNRWRKHVADDLSPYTCILPDCNEPDVLFTTKETWRRHILTEHRSFDFWVCFACPNNMQFYSEHDFIVHTTTTHASSIPQEQVLLLTTVCKRSAPTEINSCPLCNWPEGEEGEVDKDMLLDHIAREIHSFSLRALPWADDNGQETDERIDYSVKKVYDWLIENNLSENPDQERPSCEKRNFASEYFQHNAYFGSSSEGSSSNDLESDASWEVELNKLKQSESSVSFGSKGSDERSETGEIERIGQRTPELDEWVASDGLETLTGLVYNDQERTTRGRKTSWTAEPVSVKLDADRENDRVKVEREKVERQPSISPSRSEEEPYCLCGDLKFGSMICCENQDCDRKWFHLDCVGLSEVPSQTDRWYCPDCRVKFHTGVDGIVKIDSLPTGQAVEKQKYSLRIISDGVKEIVTGFGLLRDHLPEHAGEVTGVINRLHAVSNVLDRLDDLKKNFAYGDKSFLQDDLDLVCTSIIYTLEDIVNLSSDIEEVRSSRQSFKNIWTDMDLFFRDGPGVNGSLSSRLEAYSGFLNDIASNATTNEDIIPGLKDTIQAILSKQIQNRQLPVSTMDNPSTARTSAEPESHINIERNIEESSNEVLEQSDQATTFPESSSSASVLSYPRLPPPTGPPSPISSESSGQTTIAAPIGGDQVQESLLGGVTATNTGQTFPIDDTEPVTALIAQLYQAAADGRVEDVAKLFAEKLSQDAITYRDEDFFEARCQKLYEHVEQWTLRFSKHSDHRGCLSLGDINDEKIAYRFENAILDGSKADIWLRDRAHRAKVFTSVIMNMAWEFIFTRYLFGMDHDQRTRLKAAEKHLGTISPPKTTHQWRAAILALFSKTISFTHHLKLNVEAVAVEIFDILSRVLPPPTEVESKLLESLREAIQLAANIAIEMRTQLAEYIVLPPLQPEFDENGDLVRQIFFNAALMNECSGGSISNKDLAAQNAIVQLVTFPLVVKKGNDLGEGDDEIVVCPAQVVVKGSKEENEWEDPLAPSKHDWEELPSPLREENE